MMMCLRGFHAPLSRHAASVRWRVSARCAGACALEPASWRRRLAPVTDYRRLKQPPVRAGGTAGWTGTLHPVTATPRGTLHPVTATPWRTLHPVTATGFRVWGGHQRSPGGFRSVLTNDVRGLCTGKSKETPGGSPGEVQGDGSPGDGSPGEVQGDGSPGDGSPGEVQGDLSPGEVQGDGSPGDGSPGDGSPGEVQGDGSPGDGSPGEVQGDGSPGDGSPGDGSQGDLSPGEQQGDARDAVPGDGLFKFKELYENPWTVPNFLCVSRILLAPFLAHLIIEQHFDLSLALFTLAGATDLLDGYIARTWPNQKSALGSALDPLADKILISVLYVSLTYAELIPALLTALVISRDVGLIAAVFWVRYKTVPPPVTLSKFFNPCYTTAQLKPTLFSKVNTAIQLLLVASSLAAPVFHFTDCVLLQGLWCVTAVTTAASGYSYWHYGRKTVQVLNTRSP